MLFAHSADKKKDVPAQSYAGHVHGVVQGADAASIEAASFSKLDRLFFRWVVHSAAEYHDLGKLDKENQRVLSGEQKAKTLPVQHTDAGTAHLLKKTMPLSAALVRAHHIGLSDFIVESTRAEKHQFRDESVLNQDESVLDHVDATLPELLTKHIETVKGLPPGKGLVEGLKGNSAVFFRLALSCLVDGDHTDTAINYGNYPKDKKAVKLNPAERLLALDDYVSKLRNDEDERSCLRSQMYEICKTSNIHAGISSCDSPVGTGKTTAVMAHLLSQAKNRGLRRIIVVLPFTNIISQSVETYRKALILPGENAEEVVAELHHRADFQDISSRHLTALWKAPIVVTTAVAFFETLASNTPSTLRRLHNLPGSAIFVDESHAALPAKLLPLAWHWMKVFADEWQCYWVLASGSLNRFWKIPEIDKDCPDVPEVINDNFRKKLMAFETARITYRYKENLLDIDELIAWLYTVPGPRIVILNTVQSAAVVAQACADKSGRKNIEHLSTALTPQDRDAALNRIKKRLADHSDTCWTLVATSCVEAGVDLSFRTGIREIGSLVSLLQLAGRVNRHGGNEDAEVWSIRLASTGLLKQHPGLKEAASILLNYCQKGCQITPELCTAALKREIRLTGNVCEDLQKQEINNRFPLVEKDFCVINSDTRVTVIDEDIIKKLENFEDVDWRELQKKSVQIWGYQLEKLGIQEIRNGIYEWIYPYNDFLGYMAGVLPVLENEQFKGTII